MNPNTNVAIKCNNTGFNFGNIQVIVINFQIMKLVLAIAHIGILLTMPSVR